MKETGDRIAHYEILRPLGSGGMGEVLLARDTRLEREVALKLLPAAFSDDTEQIARFRREALTLASMNHPNIATIHGFEEAPDGTMVLVLEYVAGGSLADRLRDGALPPREAMRVCAQVAEALEVAHAHGVIHRDLKPANVMLGARGIIKVVDFGLARKGPGLAGMRARGETPEPMHVNPDVGATLQGTVTGTPGYMSPEQVLAGEQDERTDVFAFGCVLYECLAGQRAFPGTDAYQVMAFVLNDPPAWSALPSGLSPRIVSLLERCLEKDPEARANSMQDVRTELEEVLGIRRAAALSRGEAEEIPGNLPPAASTFVGREAELARCAALLQETRLLTLTGPGGCGKTRLALQVATNARAGYPDGAWLVELASVADAPRVLDAVASVLGVREEPGEAPLRTLLRHLATRRLMLLLDNCEHVLPACAELVTAIQREAPEVTLLVTSREPLAVTGEQVHPVPTLALPGPDQTTVAQLAGCESVALFVERARAQAPEFVLDDARAPAVAEICRQLDGIALAIELAAARVRMLSVDQIRARLGDRFKLVAGGSRDRLPRQQTLLATLQWSYDLLNAEEQALLRQLAVFAGGWTLEHATAVASPDGDEFALLDALTRLADKSLVMVERNERAAAVAPRYRYLESVRQFGVDRLEASGEAPPVRERHLELFLSLAEQSERHLGGPTQAEWLARLEPEQDNLLAALAWCPHAADGTAKALRLAGATWRFWALRSRYALGRRALEDALALDRGAAPTAARAHALVRAGGFALYQGDYDAARPLIEESLTIYRRLGDDKGIARALSGIATVASYQSDLDGARRAGQESLELYRRLGERRGMALALHNLGFVAWCASDFEASCRYFEEALALLDAVRDDGARALTTVSLAGALIRRGMPREARQRFEAALALVRANGLKREAAYALEGIAEFVLTVGDARGAARLLGAAGGLREQIGSPLTPMERAETDRFIARARAALGDEAYTTALADGRALEVGPALEQAEALLASTD